MKNGKAPAKQTLVCFAGGAETEKHTHHEQKNPNFHLISPGSS
jgi:quercetin dioxygenase-like cupin family protein